MAARDPSSCKLLVGIRAWQNSQRVSWSHAAVEFVHVQTFFLSLPRKRCCVGTWLQWWVLQVSPGGSGGSHAFRQGPVLKMLAFCSCVLLFLLYFIFVPSCFGACFFLFTTAVTHSKRSARLSMWLRDYTEFFAATAAFMCGDEMPTLVENSDIFVRNTKQVLPVLHCKQRHPGPWLYPSGRQT